MSRNVDELDRHLACLFEGHRRKDPEEHPAPEKLSAYQANELPPEEADAIQEHIIQCALCIDLLLDLERFRRDFIEADLLQRIRETLPPDLEARYKVLVLKRDSETLTPAEYEELLGISDQIEQLDVQRLEALVRLAKLREVSFETLVEELGLQPDSNG